MNIEVVYASKTQQKLISLTLPENSIVQEAIIASKILTEFPEITFEQTRVGIFGKKVSLSTVLNSGDRIEIYRPLTLNPMEKRRLLATKNLKKQGHPAE